MDGGVTSDSMEICNEINTFFSSAGLDLDRKLPLSDMSPQQFLNGR